jgi:hypothetical protein
MCFLEQQSNPAGNGQRPSSKSKPGNSTTNVAMPRLQSHIGSAATNSSGHSASIPTASNPCTQNVRHAKIDETKVALSS